MRALGRAGGPRRDCVGGREYSRNTEAVLWSRSGGRCERPTCGMSLVLDATATDKSSTIGERAHIVPFSDFGPRADEATGEEDRNDPDNLIVLCPNCHTTVDKQPGSFPRSVLEKWKVDHEALVARQLEAAFGHVTFRELDEVCAHYSGTPPKVDSDLTLIPPPEKILRNGLSPHTAKLLAMGLSLAKPIREYITHRTQDEPRFPDRLRAGFLTEYHRLRHLDYEGDALFHAMRTFSMRARADFNAEAAGLGVLSHLFESCEVFER